MKKPLLILFIFYFLIPIGFAQGSFKKNVKNAKKSLNLYFLNPKLSENLYNAKSFIDEAFQDNVGSNNEAWLIKGQIYVELIEIDVAYKSINPSAFLKSPENGNIAFEALFKSLPYFKKETLSSFSRLLPLLSNTGLDLFYTKDYCKSCRDFNNIIVVHNFLKDNKRKSPLDRIEDLNNQYYISGLAALNCGKDAEAAELFKKAFDGGLKNVEIYDGLSRSYSKINSSLAQKYLEEGRLAFPNDNNLLFSKINERLSKNLIDEQLLTLINEGILKEPGNVSLINTLANVYDKLAQEAFKNNNLIKSDGYINLAIQNYKKSLLIEGGNSFALYSLGSIYYNKAGVFLQEMQSISSDFSEEGNNKYNKLEKNMLEMFDTAISFFSKNAQIDPSDSNTLIALKEIFARKKDKIKENEFKIRLEKLK